MMCYPCRQIGVPRRAVVRAFAGSDGYGTSGGGWPGCEEHRDWAINCALETLGDWWIDLTKWRVTVYNIVETEDGDPKLQRLFTAQRRTA
jgi:hypothetical protein